MYRDKRYVAFSTLAAVLLSIFLLNRFPSTNQSYQESHEKIEAPAAKNFPGFPVDVNTASAEDLIMLPGIGEKTAQRIIAKRVEAGGFASIEEFARAARLGESRAGKIRPLISVSLSRDGGRR